MNSRGGAGRTPGKRTVGPGEREGRGGPRDVTRASQPAAFFQRPQECYKARPFPATSGGANGTNGTA